MHTLLCCFIEKDLFKTIENVVAFTNAAWYFQSLICHQLNKSLLLNACATNVNKNKFNHQN